MLKYIKNIKIIKNLTKSCSLDIVVLFYLIICVMEGVVQSQLDAFDKLSQEQQRETVLHILETIQHVNDNYHKIYDIVKAKKTLSSKILHGIYEDLIKLLAEKQQKLKELEQDALYKIHEKILHIQHLEQQAAQWEDPDSLLQSL